MTLNNSQLLKKFLLVVLAVFLIAPGCSEKKKIKGREYIPRDEFVNILVDMHLIDGITNDIKYYRKYNPKDSIDLYSSIFEKYGVDSATFRKTLDEYSMYPRLLDEVYSDVLMKLNLMQDSLDAKPPNEEPVDRRRELREEPGTQPVRRK